MDEETPQTGQTPMPGAGDMGDAPQGGDMGGDQGGMPTPPPAEGEAGGDMGGEDKPAESM